MLKCSKPADAVSNTTVWQGETPLPLDPLGFRATISALEELNAHVDSLEP